MSISGYLDTEVLVAGKVAGKVSNQFGTNESSRQLGDQFFRADQVSQGHSQKVTST